MANTKTALQKEMIRLNIPISWRSAFVRWAKRWGSVNPDTAIWLEHGALEAHQRVSKTTEGMWEMFKDSRLPLATT